MSGCTWNRRKETEGNVTNVVESEIESLHNRHLQDIVESNKRT